MIVCWVIADMTIMVVMVLVFILYNWRCFLLEKSTKNEIPLLHLGYQSLRSSQVIDGLHFMVYIKLSKVNG